MLLLVVCSEPRLKVPSFKLKIPSPTKTTANNVTKQESRRTLIEWAGDWTSRSSAGNTMMILADKLVSHASRATSI